jgi:putative colanic acid biosynthesis UDP-glucose lipid carrier transferase
MVNRYFFLLRFMLGVTDFILVNLCFFLAYYLADKYYGAIDERVYRDTLIINNMIWLVCSAITGLYSSDKIQSVKYIYQTTAGCLLLHFGLFLAYLFVMELFSFPRQFIAGFYLLTIFGFILSRFTGATLQNQLTNNPDRRKSVGIMDLNQGGLRLAEYLKSQSALNFRGFVNEGLALRGSEDVHTPYSSSQSFKAALKDGIYELYVCVDPQRMLDVRALIAEGEKYCIRVKFVPDFFMADTNFKYKEAGDIMVLSARNEPLESIGNRFKKRFFDLAVSSLVIVFILSWLYPILALIIKIQSPGPVVFKQLRSGRDNAPFWCYKFRSMRMNAQSGKQQASKNDDRITPVGRFLRKSSLDEFPQFFNVFMGSMSIIGPRPHMISHTEYYSSLIDTYMTRHFVKPGISGWAQVNGYRGETRETRLMEARVEHDIWYLGNWSMRLDIKIMFMTVTNIFKGEENAF